MLPGADGVPDPGNIETFATDVGGPDDQRPGPGGDLFSADVFDGTLRRISVGLPGVPPVDPVHEYPATLEVILTATAASGRRFDLGGHRTPNQRC